MNAPHLGRRRWLRGMVATIPVALGLPVLERALNTHGTAYADGEALPTVGGLFFWAGGVHMGFTPRSTGPLSELPRGTQSLTAHIDSVSFISGLNCASFEDYATNRHLMGPAAQLTGRPPQHGGTSGPSIDQLAADSLDGGARKSIEVGVHPNGTAEEGPLWDFISHRGAARPNPAIYDPGVLFDALVGIAPDSGAEGPSPHLALGRQAYLDACLEDASALRRQLGSHDAHQLDAYLENVREIAGELDAAPSPATCGELGERPSDEGTPEERNRLMARLTALALSCGVTRVFTYAFTRPNAFVRYPGFSDSHHNLGHDYGEHDEESELIASVDYTMERFAELLDALAAHREGDRTLLDRSCVLALSDVARNHDLRNMPVLLAGGATRGGQHVAAGGSACRAGLTWARALGAELPSFGIDDASTSEPIDELFV